MIAAAETNNQRIKCRKLDIKVEAALGRGRKQQRSTVKTHVALEKTPSLTSITLCRLAVKAKQVLAAMVRVLSSASLYLY